MEKHPSINPETWNAAVRLMAQHVDFRRSSFVHPDHEDEAKSFRMLWDEVEFINARAYGAGVEYPNQNLFDWFTSYTILTLNVGRSLESYPYRSAEGVASALEADYKMTGGSHLKKFGVDAVLTHLDHMTNEVMGWHFWWDTEYGKEAEGLALGALSEWSMRGMMLSWDLWELPADVEECTGGAI